MSQFRGSLVCGGNFPRRLLLKHIPKWAATSIQTEICLVGLKVLTHSFWILSSKKSVAKPALNVDEHMITSFYLKNFEINPFLKGCSVDFVYHYHSALLAIEGGQEKIRKCNRLSVVCCFFTACITHWQLCFNIFSTFVQNSLTIAFDKINAFPV